MADISEALRQVCQKFGITELKPLQEEAITSFVINKTDDKPDKPKNVYVGGYGHVGVPN